MTSPLLALNFSEKENDGRGYRHPLHPETKVFSVTTALKVLDKGGLAQYAANLTAAFYAANPEYSLSRSPERAYNGGRFRWNDDVKRAGERGTKVHAWFEASQKWEEGPELDDEEQQIVGQLQELLSSVNYESEHVETTVWNASRGYAGTLDSFGKLDGVPTIIDAKTSRNIWPEHIFQLAALMFSETMLVFNGTNEDEQGLIELKEKNSSQFWSEAHKWYDEVPTPYSEQAAVFKVRPDDLHSTTGELIPAHWEIHTISRDDLEPFFDGFIGALSLKKVLTEQKKVIDKFKEDEYSGNW